MFRNKLISAKIGPKTVRWRQHSATRIESFTDSVFAFAVTLIVVSLQVPETFKELMYSLSGFMGFAACFLIIMLIWFEQYMFFRKYGLQDVKTIFLNSVLLFVVLLYVYPLKFVFSLITQGNTVVHPDGTRFEKLTSNSEVDQLMLIYGIGFMVIYGIFLLLHHHALSKKAEIRLNNIEIYNTKTSIYGNIAMMSIALLSIAFAVSGLITNYHLSFLSGMCYGLIGIVLGIIYTFRKKKMHLIFSEEEIQNLVKEELVIEVKAKPK